MTSSPHRAVDRRRPSRPLRLQGAVLSAALILTAGVVLPKASDAAVGPAIPQAPAPACIPAIGIAPSYVLGESAADLDRDLAAARELGSSRYRFDVDWSVVERSRGSYDWAPVDRVVNAVLAAGLTPLGVLAYAPDWAETAGTGSFHGAPVDIAAFAAFAGAAAERYNGRITDWEIWNEPNNDAFWAPRADPATYTALLQQSYRTIKAVQPGSTVLAGALSPAENGAGGDMEPLTFLARMYDAGAGGSFDAVSVHPYSFPAMPTDPATAGWNTFQKMPGLHDLMAAHGDGGKPLWITEFGAPTGSSRVAVSPEVQAAYLTDGLSAVAGLGYVHTVLIYSIRDSGTNAADPEQNFGLLDVNFTPKPAFGAVQQLVAASRC